MLIVPAIIAGVFILMILISPCIIKFCFKFSSYIGYCKGFCASVLSAVIITVCFIVALIVIYYITLDNTTNFNATTLEPADFLVKVAIGYLFICLAFAITAYVSIFFLLMHFTKGVSTPEYTYSSIFMFISGYVTFMFVESYIAIIFYSLVVLYDHTNQVNFVADAMNDFLILSNFILLGLIMKFIGVNIMFMLYHRRILGSMFAYIAAGFFFGPLLFDLIGIFTGALWLFEYPALLIDIASFIFAIIYYCKNANENPTNGVILVNPTIEYQGNQA